MIRDTKYRRWILSYRSDDNFDDFRILKNTREVSNNGNTILMKAFQAFIRKSLRNEVNLVGN